MVSPITSRNITLTLTPADPSQWLGLEIDSLILVALATVLSCYVAAQSLGPGRLKRTSANGAGQLMVTGMVMVTGVGTGPARVGMGMEVGGGETMEGTELTRLNLQGDFGGGSHGTLENFKIADSRGQNAHGSDGSTQHEPCREPFHGPCHERGGRGVGRWSPGEATYHSHQSMMILNL